MGDKDLDWLLAYVEERRRWRREHSQGGSGWLDVSPEIARELSDGAIYDAIAMSKARYNREVEKAFVHLEVELARRRDLYAATRHAESMGVNRSTLHWTRATLAVAAVGAVISLLALIASR